MSNYDPSLAPAGKQLLSAGIICPSDRDSKAVAMLIQKAEEMLFELWPGIVPVLESKRYAGPAEVTRLTRDRVLQGQGGECSGLGQTVGQCGTHKPEAQTPIEGLIRWESTRAAGREWASTSRRTRPSRWPAP
jgi:phytoene dehydrogenase-like protein